MITTGIDICRQGGCIALCVRNVSSMYYIPYGATLWLVGDGISWPASGVKKTTRKTQHQILTHSAGKWIRSKSTKKTVDAHTACMDIDFGSQTHVFIIIIIIGIEN